MITVIPDFDLRHSNTFRMNARCRRWIEYTDPNDLPAIFADGSLLRPKCIGSGSNILFTNDYDGDLLHSRVMGMEITPLDDGSVYVRAGAGIEMDHLVEYCAERGYWGLENLSGIPGEVGASAVQNVGAYGVEAKDCIESVECFDTVTRTFDSFAPEECEYGYRTSRFKTGKDADRYIVCYVVFKVYSDYLPKLDYGHLRDALNTEHPTPMDVRKAIIAMRTVKLPNVDSIGSAGSFFKNPLLTSEEFSALKKRVVALFGQEMSFPNFKEGERIKVPAAWLIDKCGLKGYRNHDAGVWDKQPLVIVNLTGNASAEEIIEVKNHVIESVKNQFGVILSPEVEII